LVAIARTCNLAWFSFDEPTACLDLKTSDRSAFPRGKTEKTIVIYISQLLEIYRIGDRVTVLRAAVDHHLQINELPQTELVSICWAGDHPACS
jgi:ABC-type sugar transport system ATPase subunit